MFPRDETLPVPAIDPSVKVRSPATVTEPLTVKATVVGMVRSAATVRIGGGGERSPLPVPRPGRTVAAGDGEGPGEDDGGGGGVDRAAGDSPVAVGADGPGQGEGGPDRFGNGQVGKESGAPVVELPVKVCGPARR